MCAEFQNPVVCSLIPDFLLDIDKTLLASRKVKLEKWNNLNNLIESQTMEIDQMDCQYSGKEKKDKEKLDNLLMDIKNIRRNISSKTNEEHALKNQILEIKKVIENNAFNEPDGDEISVLKQKLSILKDEISSKKKNITHDLEQFKIGLWYYKKYLQCNVIYVPEDQVIFTFNQSAKSEKEASEFIRFTMTDNATTFQFVEMHPKLQSEQKMVERWNETGDIQGLILQFRKELKSLKLIS